MFKKRNNGFTLMELIAVIIIIGVLATIGMAQFSNSKERALGKEAQANLKLIQTAEKIYRMEYGKYYPQAGAPPVIDDIAIINTNLKLSLIETNWDYKITDAATDSFTARADRNGSGGYLECRYTINQASSSEPTPAVPADCPQ